MEREANLQAEVADITKARGDLCSSSPIAREYDLGTAKHYLRIAAGVCQQRDRT